MPLRPKSPGGQCVVGRADSQCVRKLVWHRYTVGNRSVSFLRCGGIEDAIANQWAHWCDPFRGFPPGTIRLPAKNVGADALIGSSRSAVPPLRSPSSQEIPGRFAQHFRQKTVVVHSGHRLISAVYQEIAFKIYLFAKDTQVKLCIFAVAPPTGSVD